MIEFTKGDIFASGCDALVNPVNCVGVMGKGLAAEFRRRFPDMFESYRWECEMRRLKIGTIHAWTNGGPWVVAFPTKVHWRLLSRLIYIESGLPVLIEFVAKNGIRSIAIPALGCGLGGLKWDLVKSAIESAAWPEGVRVVVYEPEVVS